ncbi:DMT family transporter [Nocardia yamanashiensis]|uniref:DMT family transporter n=1 Tax=Nocardia yamanashiensis TaxID=209247 RepID=UPI001E4AC139|nr:DMT family transporter [Nocardia yamanashiensis]UGT40408.1 DMT family transporter [Nocardia yamanashiensis]
MGSTRLPGSQTDPRRYWAGLGLGLSIGAGVAVQARVNGELGERLGDGVAAAAISFGSGLAVLLLLLSVSPNLRAGLGKVRAALSADRDSVDSGRAEPRLHWWHLLGGLCGAFFVASQGLTVVMLGVTVFTVAAVSGQLVSSLVVDRLGLGPAGRTPVTVWRLVAAILALAAVALTAAGRAGHAVAGPASDLLRGTPTAILIILPALAGIGLAWQQAVNGRVGAVGGPLSATFTNFAVGTVALLLAEALLRSRSGWSMRFPSEPWLYLGGSIGVVFIAAAVLAVRWIGVLLLGLTSVAGQLFMSLLLDLIVPTGPGLSVTTVLGCTLTFVAVAVAAVRPAK